MGGLLGHISTPGLALLTYTCRAEATISQPRKRNGLNDASFPLPWFMLSAAATFRRHSQALSNMFPTAMVGLLPPEPVPDCLPPSVNMRLSTLSSSLTTTY